MSPEGKVAIVTGAAGGVGRELVRGLREEGTLVVAVDVAPALHDLAGDGVATIVGNAADAGTARRAVAAATERFGRLDVLLNNAGRILWKSVVDTTDDEWDDVMAVNVRSAFVHCRAAIPVMVRGGGGAIVNTASIAGRVGMPGIAAYAASKGAVVQLTRQLAVEYAHAGIRVNAVAPGGIDTPFLTDWIAAQDDPVAVREAVETSHPLGRLATAGEIAGAILFLASDAAAFVTGEVLMVDGGYTAR